MKNFIYLFVSGILLSTAALANDDGLYGAPPPPDSAFVRVISATAPSAPQVQIGEVTVDTPALGQGSPYNIVKGGDVTVTAGDSAATMTFEKQHNYTLVLGSGKATPIEDKIEANAAKATLVFYNLSGETGVTLGTSDMKAKIFPDIADMGTANRSVNPISVTFGVLSSGKTIVGEPVKLERGKVYSIVYYKDGGDGKISTFLNSQK
jgi:alginate O-acetyltransferase complex protein AlgF